MATINIHAAKTQLSKLVEQAAAGEEIVIAKAGRPRAKLGPLKGVSDQKKRKLGLLVGRLSIPEDFDAPLPPEIQKAFEGQ